MGWVVLRSSSSWSVARLHLQRLISARTGPQGSWSEIDVELKRRHDSPQPHEHGFGLHGTRRAAPGGRDQCPRNAVAAGATGDPAKIGAAENMLSQSFAEPVWRCPELPDLKRIAAFTNLQETLTATEDKIEFSRRFYNGNVRRLQHQAPDFPPRSSRGARVQGVWLLQADDADRAVPVVNFGNLASGGRPTWAWLAASGGRSGPAAMVRPALLPELDSLLLLCSTGVGRDTIAAAGLPRRSSEEER